jgi:hypothetical protein
MTRRRILRGIGIVFLLMAVVLLALAIASWPPEGLFFALPFFFLFPAIIFGIVGGVLLLIAHLIKGPSPATNGDIPQ